MEVKELVKQAPASSFDFLAGGGEMGALIQAHDEMLSRTAGFHHHVVKPMNAAALDDILANAPPRRR